VNDVILQVTATLGQRIFTCTENMSSPTQIVEIKQNIFLELYNNYNIRTI